MQLCYRLRCLGGTIWEISVYFLAEEKTHGRRGVAGRHARHAVCVARALVVVSLAATLAGCSADDPVCKETMLERPLRNPAAGGAGIVANLLIEIGCGLQRAGQASGEAAREDQEARIQDEHDEILARAEQGDAEAQFQLGQSQFHIENPSQRRKWLCLAANQGHADAQFTLGVSKELGFEPYERDHAGAYMWYSLAMAQGNDWAAENRARVANKMTPEQVAQSERLVEKWTPDPKACEGLAA